MTNGAVPTCVKCGRVFKTVVAVGTASGTCARHGVVQVRWVTSEGADRAPEWETPVPKTGRG